MGNSDFSSDLAHVVARNIQALLERRRAEERRQSWSERLADKITRFAGSMTFVVLHAIIFGSWILLNSGWIPVKKFDPSFVILAIVASVETIFLSTFVLITQNRMSAQADKRADLDLQVSLLSEHEITRLVTLVAAIAERMGIPESQDPELTELKQDVHPEVVLEEIERNESAVNSDTL
jgi:uncharacterized membrane protein